MRSRTNFIFVQLINGYIFLFEFESLIKRTDFSQTKKSWTNFFHELFNSFNSYTNGRILPKEKKQREKRKRDHMAGWRGLLSKDWWQLGLICMYVYIRKKANRDDMAGLRGLPLKDWRQLGIICMYTSEKGKRDDMAGLTGLLFKDWWQLGIICMYTLSGSSAQNVESKQHAAANAVPEIWIKCKFSDGGVTITACGQN